MVKWWVFGLLFKFILIIFFSFYFIFALYFYFNIFYLDFRIGNKLLGYLDFRFQNILCPDFLRYIDLYYFNDININDKNIK